MNQVQARTHQTFKWIGIGAVKANHFVGEVQKVLKEVKASWCNGRYAY